MWFICILTGLGVSKNNKALLCYNLCRSLLASQFLSDFCLTLALYAEIPSFYAKIPAFYADIFIFFFRCDGNAHGQFPIVCLQSVSNDSVCMMPRQGGRAGTCWWQKLFMDLRAKLFWKPIYCFNLIPNPNSQSGSWSNRGLGKISSCIMW